MYFSVIIHPHIKKLYPMPIPYDLVRRPGKEALEERPFSPFRQSRHRPSGRPDGRC